jgi:hypothetical protein
MSCVTARIASLVLVALALSACSVGRLPMPQAMVATQDGKGTGSKAAALGGSGVEARRDGQGQPRAVLGHVDRAPLPGMPEDRRVGTTGTPIGPGALDIINELRQAKGLGPVTISPELTKAAQMQAMDLARSGKLSHFGSDGSTPLDRVRRAGYRPRMTAENIATGQSSVEAAVRSWQTSESHNRNLLLPDATHMGIAVVEEPKGNYWALVIGAPL